MGGTSIASRSATAVLELGEEVPKSVMKTVHGLWSSCAKGGSMAHTT